MITAQLTIGKIGAFKHECIEMGSSLKEAFTTITEFALFLDADGWQVEREFDDLLTAKKSNVYLLLHLTTNKNA
jgi:hypothetical protein